MEQKKKKNLSYISALTKQFRHCRRYEELKTNIKIIVFKSASSNATD